MIADSHPRLGRNVDVRRARNGDGLFASKGFAPKAVITRITGRIVAPSLLWKRGGTFMDNCFRFGPETYLDPGDGAGRYLNHSCDPNCAIGKTKNRLFLNAIRTIRRGEELVIDYSTILGDDDIWTMRCRCGAPSCRKRIGRFGSLPRATRDRYIALEMVPGYVLRSLVTP